MNYMQSVDFCEVVLSGMLAEPRTEEEQETLEGILDTNNHYWIGM